MAIDNRLQVFNEEGQSVDYDILASDVKFLSDGKDLPTKLAELEQEIEDAGQGEGTVTGIKVGSTTYEPTEGVVDLSEPFNDKVDKETGKELIPSTDLAKLQNLPTATELTTQLGTKANDNAVVKSVTINGETPQLNNGNVSFTVTGAQGPKGDTGATGPQGPAGPQGPKGDSGVSSADEVVVVNDLDGEPDNLEEGQVAVLGAAVGETIADQFAAVGTTSTSNDNADLDIEDEDGNVILRLNGGHIQTKNFNSEQIGGSEGKSISILFVGNSLTQDAVSYLPLVLKEIVPNLDFKLYMWYDGGYTLTQILNKWNNNQSAQIFSRCVNGTSWSNDAYTKMSNFLGANTIDIVCFEEYFNYKRADGYTAADKQVFNDAITFIRNNYGKPFKVVSFFHQPLRKSVDGSTARQIADAVYNLTEEGVLWQLRNTISESVIPAGIATYMAMDTALDSLGDSSHLSPDGTHSQEGLPCLMQAWVVAMWIFDQLGIPASINNAQARVTNDNYASINVPGANLGSGVVVGTTEQDRLAMDVAIAAFKEGKKIEINALIGQDNNG